MNIKNTHHKVIVYKLSVPANKIIIQNDWIYIQCTLRLNTNTKYQLFHAILEREQMSKYQSILLFHLNVYSK